MSREKGDGGKRHSEFRVMISDWVVGVLEESRRVADDSEFADWSFQKNRNGEVRERGGSMWGKRGEMNSVLDTSV